MNTKLRDIRKARALTLNEVASAVGIDASNLSRIERGLQAPGNKLAIRLHKYYRGEVSLMDILTISQTSTETAA